MNGSFCASCIDEISNCVYCSDIRKECVKCMDGYALVGGRCSACPDHCLSCAEVGTCDACESGYFVNESGVCSSCDSVKGCATCSSERVCRSCVDGYYLEGTRCLKCSAGCVRCDARDYCFNCTGSFGLLHGKCVHECPWHMANVMNRCVAL